MADDDNGDGPTYFKDMGDIRRRKHYSDDHTIMVDNFGSIVGSMYHFKEDAYCQVEREGIRCNHAHKNGWLGKRKDQAEALIGKDCGNKYFIDNDEFRREKDRVNLEERIENQVAALAEALKDRGAMLARCEAAATKFDQALDRLRQMNAALPSPVLSRLSDMVRTGNRIVSVDAQFVVDVNEQGREIKEWSERQLGSINGVSMWEDQRELWPKLDAIKLAISEAVLSRHEKESKLKHWRETIDELPRVEESIENFTRSCEDFCAESNLVRLCFLVKTQQSQIDIMMLVLKVRGDAKPTQPKAQQLLNELTAQARKATNSLNIRVL